MDSFFSLFDPTDGHQSRNKRKQKTEQDNVKKKTEPVKGRRRGRKCQGKNETLPEESSFLCEPELSTELLVKDGSYIESFIEVNKKEDTKTQSVDKKPNRRNSSRKNRRKKNKVSPAKELTPNTAWDDDTLDTRNLNNLSSIPKFCDDNIGKNVNNLKTSDGFKKNKRKSVDDANFQDRDVYNVIDKLEKVGLKDDMYLAGDFDTDELDNDFFYSSDELDDSFDDTGSEADDSGDEVYASPPEPRFGNVEYKLQLVSPCERRFQHLVTQLKWRLRSGGGSAVYVVGVRDCGALRGLRARPLRASLRALQRMARALTARLHHVALRRVAPQRAVAEVYIRKLADCQQSVELRVAVMGANEAGKSTLIGVLTQGELDNGRGSARLNMFRHLHEVKSGRTSSLSHEILGFDAQGNVVNYGCSELMTAERIGERSAKLVSFLDLAGHSKYQRTTLHGLTGYSPHYAMLVISATAGITRITEEHVGLLLALDMPFFAVITKCELAGAVQPLVSRLAAMIASANKKPLLITDENLARNCVAPQKLILDTIDEPGLDVDTDTKLNDQDSMAAEQIPVFPVSCVRGGGLNALHAYLLALQPPAVDLQPKPEDETCEFQIDEIFHVGESSGPVVGGLLARGQIFEGDNLMIGPMENGEFVQTTVRSIYRNRVPCGSVRAGHCASLGLPPPGGAPRDPRGPAGQGTPGGPAAPRRLRAGQVLLAVCPGGRTPRPTFGCPPGRCKTKMLEKIRSTQQDKVETRKAVRRKNKNLLQDLRHVEHSLVKDIENIDENIFKSDTGDKNINQISDKNIYRSTKESDPKLVFVDKLSKHSTKVSGVIHDKNIYNLKEDHKNISVDRLTKDGEPHSDVEGTNGVENDCVCDDKVYLEDPNDPRGCLYFQANVHVLRHSTAISRGFQCTLHVGNVRQTAIIEGIMSRDNLLRAGEAASVLFRFVRCPEYLVRGRRLLFTAGLGTRAIGRITQVFPYIP
ncbi:LOW QUALITY PROTEIN: GTP-binding protein 2 [Aphomia sociella]